MDKIDLIMIPFLYLFRMTISILSLLILLVPTPTTIGRILLGFSTRLKYLGIRLLLAFIYRLLHGATSFRPVKYNQSVVNPSILAHILLEPIQTK